MSKDLSRRDFLRQTISAGATLTAASAAVGAVLLQSGCAPADEDGPTGLISEGQSSDGVVTVSVPASKVILAQNFTDAPFTDYLQLEYQTDLPVGSLLYQVDSTTILVLLPSEENKNSRELAFLDLNTGNTSTIVKKPIGATKNTVIYDARASKTRLVWVELDLSDNSWFVYVVPLSGATPGDALIIDEGDLDYEPPMLAVYNDKVFWTHMPMAAGAANQEDSYLRAIEFDPNRPPESARQYDVWVSHGRMITNPLISGDVLTFVPRVDADLVYYQLTALQCSNDRQLEHLVMPTSLRVSEALYLGEKFSFSIERNYAYAEGLSNFGTYLQLDNDEYLHFSRTPMSPVVMFRDHLLVKSTANVVGVDIAAQKTFVITLPERCSDYGEALVGWGAQDKVITSSVRLNEDGTAQEALMLRVFVSL